MKKNNFNLLTQNFLRFMLYNYPKLNPIKKGVHGFLKTKYFDYRR